MPCCWILTLLLVAADGPQGPAVEPDRARRAAIVDRVMGEPTATHLRLNHTLTTELVEVGEPDREGLDVQEDGAKFMVVLERDNLDRWVFCNMTSDRTRRAWLERLLQFKAEQASKAIPLTRPQLEKLQLAGRGDIKRFFDRVEEIRPDFEVARKDMEQGRRFLLDDLKPLRDQFQAGPFGGDSLFAKTLKKIENDALEARPGGK